MSALLALFPPGSAVAGDGMLTLGGCRADALAEEFGTDRARGRRQRRRRGPARGDSPRRPHSGRARARDPRRDRRDARVRADRPHRLEVRARTGRGGRADPPDRAQPEAAHVPATGAYCFTMANNYNGNRRIPVVFVRDGEARIVVRRETWEDLMARDVG